MTTSLRKLTKLWDFYDNTCTIAPSVTVKLYVSLVTSQLIYCSPAWRPHLSKDICKIEQLQCRANKYILHDLISGYKTWLINLNLFPLMYIWYDVFYQMLKNPTPSFDINLYIYLSPKTSLNLCISVKLHHNITFTNREYHF